MTVWGVLFGVAVCAVFGVALLGVQRRRDLDAVWASCVFIGTWTVGKVIAAQMGAWANIEMYTAVEAGVAFVFLLLCQRDGLEDWKADVIKLSLAKQIATTAFWVSGGRHHGPLAINVYLGLLDIGLSAQLACVVRGSRIDAPEFVRRLGSRPRRADSVALSARRIAQRRTPGR